jgi:fatty acid desaturase
MSDIPLDTSALDSVSLATLRAEPVISPAELRVLSVRSDMRGAVRFAGHAVAVIGCGTLIWWVHARFGLPWALPLIMLQSLLVAFLFMPLHETAHKTAFRNNTANLVVGHFCGFVIMLPYEYYRVYHWEHHRHTQDPARDPELLVGSIPSSDAALVLAYSGLMQVARREWLMLGHAFTGTVTVPWVPEKTWATVVAEARLHVAGYAALLALSLVLQSALLLWVWILPLLLGQMVLRPYLYAEHTGCAHTRSAFENTRTTAAGALLQWLAWNMPYHVEHHAYPSVPFHALPALHERIVGRIVHRGRNYRSVTRETWAWFRRARQYGRQFD